MLSFARPIQLDSVRLDHPDSAFIPSSLLYFTSGTLVANATVDPGSNSTTAFAQDELVDSLEVEIRGQLGSKYTCLGRFHVFGQLAEAAEV